MRFINTLTGLFAVTALIMGANACSGQSIEDKGEDAGVSGTGGTASAGNGGAGNLGGGGVGGGTGGSHVGGGGNAGGPGGDGGTAGSGPAGWGGGCGTGGLGGGGVGGGGPGGAGAGGGGAGGGTQVQPVVPQDAVATDISLEVYSDGWGKLLKTLHLDKEGPITISVEEDHPYSDPPQYFIYAKAKGFYTELYYCTKGQTIDVDLDAVPKVANALTGVIFVEQSFFAHRYMDNEQVLLIGPNGTQHVLKTDKQGRYGLQGLPTGDYKLSFSYDSENFAFDLKNTTGTDYKDIGFMEPMQAAAPNLYLYPTTTTRVKVSLSFPQGGSVIDSAPPYLTGWDVNVTPSGKIDGKYGYLFYEANLPQIVDTSRGWMLNGTRLESELRSLLTHLGFQGREIQDFLDYWIPVLGHSPWFAVYPQDPEKFVTLHIDPKPDAVRRILLLIRPMNQQMSMVSPPASAPFVRKGFVATEWGVLRGL